MRKEFTAVIKQDGEWWLGWIEEIPGVNCQERTRDELLDTLRVILAEALEFNRQEALSAAGADFQEEKIAIWKGGTSSGISKPMGASSLEGGRHS